MRKTFATTLALTMLGIAPASAYELSCDPSLGRGGGHATSINAVPGVAQSAAIDSIFKSDKEDTRDLGPNPNLTDVSWSTTEYFTPGATLGIVHSGSVDRIFFEVKSADALNRMAYPPPSPFEITMTAGMENDDGKTASCEVTLESRYVRNPVAFVPTISDPEDDGPRLKTTTALAPAGTSVSAFASYFFENAGLGAELTAAEFQTTQYYNSAGVSDGILDITVKSAAELAALPYPPPKPFEVQVTLTMTNNAGETATGTVTYRTEW